MAKKGAGPRKRKTNPGKKTSQKSEYGFEIVIGVVFAILVAVIWSFVSERSVDQGKAEIEQSAVDQVDHPDQIIEVGEIPQEAFQDKVAALAPTVTPKAGRRRGAPSVSIIIDDLGADPLIVEKLFSLNVPIAFSILPHQKFSKSVALNVRKVGQVVMLHLPMEPKSKSENPGAGALRLSYEDFLIIKIFEESINSIPGVEGVNNHMGSSFTENKAKMSVVMNEIKKRGLFFIDSRTTAGTVAFDTAVTMGVPAAERSVFLDNDREKEKIVDNLMALARKAIQTGSAIGIGHPYSETIEALALTLPIMEKMGVRIVPVTAILAGADGR